MRDIYARYEETRQRKSLIVQVTLRFF